MKSILERMETEIIEKKSLFLNYMIPVRNSDQAKEEYLKVKNEHADANHHCYAYVLGVNQETQKSFDAGEPNRTAGFPMLEVLLKNDLTDILTVTVRYYGGIKLGAGGLVRAYSKSVSEALKNARFAFLTVYDLVEVIVPFDLIGAVEHFIRSDYELINTEYNKNVHYFVEIEQEKTKKFAKWVQEQTSGKGTTKTVKTFSRYK
mgnify:CR=1 FL=1